jgi:bla regulator protein BlaR1
LHHALVRRRLVTNTDVLEVLEDCKALARVHAPLVVMETTEVKTPALFGFVRPRLLLPEGMLRSFSREDLRHVFIHELSHLRRNDIAVGWLQAVVLTIHWFNPVVWFALHRWRGDREFATDELALHHLEVNENRDYGSTILKLLENSSRPVPLPAVAGILEDRRQLVGRIRQIARFGEVRRSTVLAVMILLAVALVSLTDGIRQAEGDVRLQPMEVTLPLDDTRFGE